MNKEQIFEVLNKNPAFFLATVEGDAPHVRGMLLYKADESGIVFHTGPHKDVYHQMLKNPKTELCFYDATQNIQVRVRGTVEMVDDIDLKREISSHPSRAFMQGWKANCATEQDFYKMFSVFRLINGIANVWTFQTNFTPKEDIELQ